MLSAFRKSISTYSYPGYPKQRLVLDANEIPANITLPEGPWTASHDEHPSPEERAELLRQGYTLDDNGRPLHPFIHDMLTDPTIGVVTGKGKYWNWGKNKSADPIVITDEANPKILLIQRGDTGIWALPGGFRDPGESSITTAKRELFEEAGLLLLGDDGVQVYDDIVGDLRSTAHAWGETTAHMWKVPSAVEVEAGDDALDAKWYELDNLPEKLSNPHRIIIKRAIADIALVNSLSHAIPVPKERKAYKHASGGHMGYHKIIIDNHNGSQKFIKSQDSSMFTDTSREANSRMYLHKEAFYYSHVLPHAPHLIPESVRLIDDNSLIMSAHTPEAGWHWRAPARHAHEYASQVIDALLELQNVPIPDDSHIPIRATYKTHAIEGWDSITAEQTHDAIRRRINDFMPRMKPAFRTVAKRLKEDLDQLAQAFEEIREPEELYFAHHDIRQANLAWHNEHGTKIIDWSWAGPGRKNSDVTTLLIDMHKAGHDVSEHMQHFSREHAVTLIGFWLGHSLWPTCSDDDTVRLHQVASAVSAYDLLTK